jgi:DNA polymerase
MDRAAALKALAGDSALGAPTARTRSGRESLAAVLNEGRSDQRESGAGVVRGAPRPTVSAAAPRTRKAALRSPTPEVTAGLTTLADAAAACTRCGLHAGRQQVVFGEGNAAADLVVVGEAPGQEEDKTGRPFVGRAGRLLDLLLLSAGFPRKEVYICNVLKCRPPNNRNPQADEMDLCTRNFLYGQLDLIAPRALLAVGRFAVQALLETTESIGRLRGRLHTYRGTPLIVSYHPAYLLRSPNMVRAAWSDYQLARTVLDEPV